MNAWQILLIILGSVVVYYFFACVTFQFVAAWGTRKTQEKLTRQGKHDPTADWDHGESPVWGWVIAGTALWPLVPVSLVFIGLGHLLFRCAKGPVFLARHFHRFCVFIGTSIHGMVTGE